MIQFRFYKLYVQGTAHKQNITLERGLLCSVKPTVKNVIAGHRACHDRHVFFNTKSLKHIYDRHIFDKQNPIDFLVILNNITKIIRYPDELYRDMESKRGDFLLVKKVNGQRYFVSIEVGLNGSIDVVSSSATGEKYLKKFTLLWSWGTANPPS